MNIPDKLRQPENRKLEFKREFPARSNLLKTIVAFANGAGNWFSIFRMTREKLLELTNLFCWRKGYQTWFMMLSIHLFHHIFQRDTQAGKNNHSILRHSGSDRKCYCTSGLQHTRFINENKCLWQSAWSHQPRYIIWQSWYFRHRHRSFWMQKPLNCANIRKLNLMEKLKKSVQGKKLFTKRYKGSEQNFKYFWLVIIIVNFRFKLLTGKADYDTRR